MSDTLIFPSIITRFDPWNIGRHVLEQAKFPKPQNCCLVDSMAGVLVVMAVHVSELSVALVAAVVQMRGSRFRVMIGGMVA